MLWATWKSTLNTTVHLWPSSRQSSRSSTSSMKSSYPRSRSNSFKLCKVTSARSLYNKRIRATTRDSINLWENNSSSSRRVLSRMKISEKGKTTWKKLRTRLLHLLTFLRLRGRLRRPSWSAIRWWQGHKRKGREGMVKTKIIPRGLELTEEQEYSYRYIWF